MSSSLAIKNASNGCQDIYFDDSGQLAFVTGKEYTAQRIRTRLQLFLGEWVFDTSQGVPWFEQVFVKPADIITIESIIKNTILETPNVISLLSYTDNLNHATREYSVNFSVDTTDGIVTDDVNLFALFKGRLNYA